MTDAELLTLLRTEPDKGQRALYDQYFHYVYAIIFRILRDAGTEEDVEDCLIEVLAEVMQQAGSIRGDSLQAYLGSVARNRALNARRAIGRRRAHVQPLEIPEEPGAHYVEETAEQNALRQRLLSEIHALGEPDATILIQKYYYDRKTADIAKIVGLRTGAVQMRCTRALRRLRQALSDWI